VYRYQMTPTAGLYHGQRSEPVVHAKGETMGGGYMPDGERTCVDDSEKSGVHMGKQRKGENGGIGHHDGVDARMSS
jgi:hypothetical protein